jgi:hypothetical protein
MKKIFALFLILICLLSKGQELDQSSKKNKLSINFYSGLLRPFSGSGVYIFGDLTYYKFNLPFDFNINFAHKGKKRWHEFGVVYLQKTGSTKIKSGYVNCNSQVFLTNVSYYANYNYWTIHYGIEFPFKNELFSIIPFLRIGHSFNSNYEKTVEPFCYKLAEDLSIYEKTPYLETGLGLNYILIQKKHFKSALRFRSSFRGIKPEADIFFSLGLILEIN